MLSCVRLFVTPWTAACQAPLSLTLDKNTGVGCHALIKGIFPTQESNPGLPYCRRILYELSHKGSPIAAEVSMKCLGYCLVCSKNYITVHSFFHISEPIIPETNFEFSFYPLIAQNRMIVAVTQGGCFCCCCSVASAESDSLRLCGP